MVDEDPDLKCPQNEEKPFYRNELWNPLSAAGSTAGHIFWFLAYCFLAVLIIIPILGMVPLLLLGLSKWAGYAMGLGISIILLIRWERKRGEDSGIIIIECMVLTVLSYFLLARMMPHFHRMYSWKFSWKPPPLG